MSAELQNQPRGGCRALLTSAGPNRTVKTANAAVILIAMLKIDRALFTCLFPFQIFIYGFDKHLCFRFIHQTAIPSALIAFKIG